MKRLFIIAAIALASPAAAQGQCTLATHKNLGVSTERLMSQIELFLPSITQDEQAFFDAEVNAMTDRFMAGKPDAPRDRYVSGLKNHDIWDFRNQLKQVIKHKDQFERVRVPITKGQLVRGSATMPLLLHSISQLWNSRYLSGKLKPIDVSIAIQVRNDLDDQMIRWSMFLQTCGAEIG